MDVNKDVMKDSIGLFGSYRLILLWLDLLSFSSDNLCFFLLEGLEMFSWRPFVLFQFGNGWWSRVSLFSSSWREKINQSQSTFIFYLFTSREQCSYFSGSCILRDDSHLICLLINQVEYWIQSCVPTLFTYLLGVWWPFLGWFPIVVDPFLFVGHFGGSVSLWWQEFSSHH